MGFESSASPSGKRSRDAEDEVYLDNFHAQKRYLSEVMASSLNGLSFGESLDEHLMESPARSEGMCISRDEISLQYSPMSEDLDDARYIENPINTTAQVDSTPTSPVSPHRHQRPPSASSQILTSAYPSLGSSLTAVTCSPSRPRGSDSENRLPSSPSDICHPGDLRRAALLRSVQMRTQPLCSPSIELPSCLGRETMQNIESEEEQSCSCMGTLADERDYQNQEQASNLFIEECSSSMVMSEGEITQKSSCRVLDMNVKGEDISVVERSGSIPSRRSHVGEDSKSCVVFK